MKIGCHVSAYGTPGIFIPIKGHFEQEDNARNE